ncbi:MAG: lysostaphin resistance A-like protein, partial [Bacteroidia bacterium]
MDDLQEGKDIETKSSRPNSSQAVLHLFLGILFFLGSMMVLAAVAIYICSYMVSGTVGSVEDGAAVVASLTSHPYALKLFVFLSSSLPLIVGVLITLYVMKANARDFLLLNFPKNVKWFGLSVLFVFIAIPLMGMFLEINKLLDFSQWPDFNNWLLKQESANNGTYEAMIGEKSTLSFITSLLFMALIPAIAEEIFFRGFLMNVFNGVFKNMHLSILFTAVIFSLIHMQF